MSEVVASRRNFLKGFAALAAVAVLPKTLVALASTDRERLVASMLSDHTIVGQTFLLYDATPVTLANMSRLAILNCRFKWMVPFDGPFIHIVKCDYVTLQDCVFESTAA